MNKNKATLAIYGIQDRIDSEYPLYVHDHSICLMRNGRVEKMLQLERKTRVKRDNKLYLHIYDLLKEQKLISTDDYDVVFVDNVVGRSFINKQGNIRFEAPLVSTVSDTVEKGRCWWFDKGIDAYALNHELAHISSCLPFYGNFKENSLVVHFDGGASLSNFSSWLYKDNKLQLIDFNWDFKYLSSLYNANALVFGIIGAKQFDQNSVPGKMMGMASFGEYSLEIENWLKENNYFEDCWKSKAVFYEKARESFGWKNNKLDQKDSFLHDILATMQFVFQRDFYIKIEELQSLYKSDYLYYSGGSALNIVTNNKLVESGLFKQVYIPPCAEDSGLALGAAAYVEYLKHGKVEHHSPYLNNWGIEDYKSDFSSDDISVIASELMAGKILAVCNDFGEIGPRALGNRSIISLANSKELADKVSMEKKGREWYRPIAPIMLERNLEYFTGIKDSLLATYMLRDFEVLSDKRKEIEGVVHVNGTSRIQTVSNEKDNPFIYTMLDYLEKNYGVKALINTSFNKRGEPIVHTEDDAIASAKNMQLDGVILNGKLKLI